MEMGLVRLVGGIGEPSAPFSVTLAVALRFLA